MGTPLARAETLSVMMQGQIWEYSLPKTTLLKFQNGSSEGEKKNGKESCPEIA